MSGAQKQINYWKQASHRSFKTTKLAVLADVEVTKLQIQDLRTITTFNIAGRYDDVKLAFYKQCTPTFTKRYLTISQQFFLWLKQEYRKR